MTTSSSTKEDALYIAVVAENNHPGLKYVPEKLALPNEEIGGSDRELWPAWKMPITVKLSRVDEDLAFENKEFSYDKIGGLLYIPPGETQTLEKLWEKVDVPWMHCFL